MGSRAAEAGSSRSPVRVINEVITVQHGVPQGSALRLISGLGVES